MSSSDPVLGYPAVEPPTTDCGSAPTGMGAKPSVRSSASTKTGSESKPAVNRGGESRSGPPLPKRSKGRLFVGSVLLAAVVAIGYSFFNSVLRYTAYGEVVGRRIELTVPWGGVIESIHVREGDEVRHGDLIVRIDNLEHRQRIDEIDDALRLERAQLASDLAMLRWEAEKIRDARKLSQSEFYDKWSELLWEQSKLVDLQTQLARLEPVEREGAAATGQVQSLKLQVAGQDRRVEQLTEAVRALQQRSEQSPIEIDLEDRVQPTLARIENLQAELQRTREKLQRGEIRAPTSGRIVRTHRFAGEYAAPSEPVVELLVEGSTELVLYLPQSEVQHYPVGRTVKVHVNPTDTHLTCAVERVALEMVPAPDSLSRHYEPQETLLPVFLRVTDDRVSTRWLTLGSELRLPRAENLAPFSRLRSWWNQWNPSAVEVSGSTQPEQSALPATAAQEQDPPLPGTDTESIRAKGRVISHRGPAG